MLCVPGIHYPTLHHTIALNYNREMVNWLIITDSHIQDWNNYLYEKWGHCLWDKQKNRKNSLYLYTILYCVRSVLYYTMLLELMWRIFYPHLQFLCVMSTTPTATSQENKQSEENCADISAKTLLALGAVHKSLFGCESSPISCNVRTLVSQLVSKCNKAPSKAQ